MPTVSQYYKLNKSQTELDFVNVKLEKDNPLFIDPYALSRRQFPWCENAHDTLAAFFQRIVDSIRSGKHDEARELLSFLREPNETRLGLSKGKPQGAGIGNFQADALFDALRFSAAVKTGLLNNLEECELMIDGISWDKISDLATNVIRLHLIEYTKDQCLLHSIPTAKVPLPPYYDPGAGEWFSDYHDVPVPNGNPLVLVPKIIARYHMCYDAGKYYNSYVLDFIQTANINNPNSQLVRTLRNGKRIVFKKQLKKEFPISKSFLLDFSQKNPDLLKKYRDDLAKLEKIGIGETIGDEHQETIAKGLLIALKAIAPGTPGATIYHNLMMGALELLFYPSLTSPKKEHEINDGRKRIDIVFSNDSDSGVFRFLRRSLKLRCAYIIFECKNYSADLGNPELDQLVGRFNQVREAGFICCRSLDNPKLFIARCRDTFSSGRGLAVPLEDGIIIKMLEAVVAGRRELIDTILANRVNEICSK